MERSESKEHRDASPSGFRVRPHADGMDDPIWGPFRSRLQRIGVLPGDIGYAMGEISTVAATLGIELAPWMLNPVFQDESDDKLRETRGKHYSHGSRVIAEKFTTAICTHLRTIHDRSPCAPTTDHVSNAISRSPEKNPPHGPSELGLAELQREWDAIDQAWKDIQSATENPVYQMTNDIRILVSSILQRLKREAEALQMDILLDIEEAKDLAVGIHRAMQRIADAIYDLFHPSSPPLLPVLPKEQATAASSIVPALRNTLIRCYCVLAALFSGIKQKLSPSADGADADDGNE